MLFLSWLLFISFASLFSFNGKMISPRLNIPHIDKLVHFVFYFGLVVLAAKAAKEISKGILKPGKTLMYIVVFAIVYGILIELLQYGFTENRHGDVLDVLANSLGAVTGMLVAKRLVFKDWSLK